MTSYDNFAAFYDLTMGDRSDVTRLLQELIETHHPTAKSVLELGSGTGQILEAFSGQFEVAGVEKSVKMLQISQQKLPAAALIEGDIRNFKLDQRYDVIICVFDTINHLPDISDWDKVFERTLNHLAPNGLFIFDMNTVGRMQKLLAMESFIQQSGDTIIQMDLEPAGPDAVDWLITVQHPGRDGIMEVTEDSARERSYPLADVRTTLEQKFTIIEQFDSSRQPANDESDRVYFVCRPN